MDNPSEPRYTLAEAKRRLAEMECTEHGHDLDQVRLADGTTVSVFCGRCPATFEPPFLPPLPPESQLRQDIFRGGGKTSVRLTHVTTGLTGRAAGGITGRDDRRRAELLLRARLLVVQLEKELDG